MVKALDCWNRSKLAQTPVVLLRSLLNKYPWERYDHPYPPSYVLIVPLLFFSAITNRSKWQVSWRKMIIESEHLNENVESWICIGQDEELFFCAIQMKRIKMTELIKSKCPKSFRIWVWMTFKRLVKITMNNQCIYVYRNTE